MTNTQKRKVYNHRWYLAHRTRILKQNKLYAQQHKEQGRKRQRNYLHKNWFKYVTLRGIKWRFKLDSYAEALELYNLRKHTACQICGSLDHKHIDHDHRTGKVRGILCIRCNSKLEWAVAYKRNIKRYLTKK